MIGLEYFTEDLKVYGFEVVVLIDANAPIDHSVREQSHQHKYKSNNGFHIDGSIDGSIATYIRNCSLSNILVKRHAESDSEIPNTHLRGSKQIEFVLETPGITLFIDAIWLLDFGIIFRTDNWNFFIDINIVGFLGSRTESLPAQRFRQLKLEDPRVATEYRRILHQQFIHHNVFYRIKEKTESSKSGVWTMVQESKYDALDTDITRAMLHVESVCLLKHKHITPWLSVIGRATSTIRYWDLRIKLGGI
jgi:hypothetical protein